MDEKAGNQEAELENLKAQYSVLDSVNQAMFAEKVRLENEIASLKDSQEQQSVVTGVSMQSNHSGNFMKKKVSNYRFELKRKNQQMLKMTNEINELKSKCIHLE